ncbi:non-ribosomal peptide synthetase [Burkholderia glumae]|uniref:Non-ribosomal peptide synthetase n=11 Tax=Burkholderia glumae TaxID=337 RepID=A0ABY5BA04_BURGL|nr:non-ribosomal peptide synthetase [Burkholderia glumae]ACR31387.1 putative non-ribosomal peptide synthetase [Burkholderia glumae BGR1]QTP36103.1 Tyrocidine synthase 3 [Burkholderia glumae]USS43848.1 non-ribosomal peptide synthetase [Burkholderia glumae]UVS92955.1 non-ribosomal peptide synthetase [Burkholderia glumae]UVT01503.1 non-ribosomal peptide synthetase [Burkholderia glumae]
MADNMIERLRSLAERRGTDTALVTVDAHGDTRYDYAALERRAIALAARLRERGAGGQAARVLLAMDSGIDYVAAFFGCLYAGAIAVPVYPPESLRGQHLARLAAIAADADAAVVVTTRALAAKLGEAFERIAPGAACIEMDGLDHAGVEARAFVPYAAAPADIAFLQYTSGSTSTPKGVMVTHGSLWANEIAIREGLGVTADDVFVSWLPLYHDMGLIGTLSQPVFSGIALVLMSPQFFLERPVRWLEAIARHRGTISGGPDFAYRLCAERIGDEACAALDLSSWRLAFSGSEPVRKATLDAFVARFAPQRFDPAALFPCYGLAEATLYVSGAGRGRGARAPGFDPAALERGRALADAAGTELVSCGRPPSGHQLAIVERESGAALADGAIGEILVRGPSVAAGYWRRADATAASFVERDGAVWLRTGDLGFVHQGELFVAGRIKDLLIVRGRNLYPQDLELAIEREVDLVRRGRVAAFAVELQGQEGIGIAAEVSRNVQKLATPEAIGAALTEAVALACGEPVAVVVLLNPGGLPKTSSGKVQRAACGRGWRDGSLDAWATLVQGARRDAAAAPAGDGAGEAAAATDIELALAAIWRELLPAVPPRPSASASFFALGGSSLAAVQVAAAVQARWAIDYTARDVFAAPGLREAAARIGERLARGAAAPAVAFAPLDAEARRVAVAADAQRSLWLTWLREPSSAAYNMSGELRLDGALDAEALRLALDDVVRAHDVLRARFELGDEGEALQIVEPELAIALPLTVCETAAELERVTRAVAQAPFDLETGPLLRAQLVRTAPDSHRLLIALHHIVADGWSVNLLLDALGRAYAARTGGAAPASAPAWQYTDYVAWERASLGEAALRRQLDYWRTQLAGDGDPAAAARLFARPANGAGGRQRGVEFSLPREAAAKLRRFAAERRATPFMAMLAVLNAVLHELSGRDEIRVGAPVSLRKRPEAQALIGYFINVQVLRTRLDPQRGFATLLEAVRDTVLAAHEHQDVPFDRLVSALLPNRANGDETLFQVKLTEQRPFETRGFAPLDAQLRVLLNETPHFDLALDFTDRGTSIDCLLAYDDAVFDAAFAARFVARFTTFAARLVEAPALPLGRAVTDAAAAADAGRAAAAGASEADDLLSLWDASVARAGARLALRDGGRGLSYAELDAAADALAARLVALGAGTEARVAVLAERSIEHVLAMLAALKAGATWLPLDPRAPAARLSAQLADSGAAVLLHAVPLPQGLATAAAVPLALRHQAPPAARAPRVAPALRHAERAAYLIYTSGSTGEPKGVVVTHRALVNYLRGMLATLDAPADASFAMVSTPAADLGHTTLFGALVSGRTLHLLAPDLVFQPDAFARYMAEHRVGVLKIVPSHLAALLSAAQPARVLPAEALILGGERTPAALLARIGALAPACRVFNHYGPTETTVGVAMHAWPAEAAPVRDLPLGRALPGMRIHLLDAKLAPVADGEDGELYIGGPGVARGYHGRAGLTAERFVPDPFVAGERLYRTGDLGRIGADGLLEYRGRADDQVKVRGYRVEPAEVERALAGIDGVRGAAVIAHAAPGGTRLAAFVVGGPRGEALRAAAARVLPDYMVPAEAIALEALPLNANGKLDRAALRARLEAHLAQAAQAGAALADASAPAPDAPQGEIERTIAAIWADVIEIEAGRIGRGRNFFEVGGDSLLGLKVVARARKAGITITPKQLFERLTLAQLAEKATAAGAAKAAGNVSSAVSGGVNNGAAASSGAAPAGASEGSAIPRLPAAARLRGPASYAQQRLWFLWQLAPASRAYHVSGGLWLTGEVDAAALRDAFAAIVARHDALRTRFAANEAGEVEAWVDAAASIDWRDETVAHGGLEAAARALADEPFDLGTGPLLRAALYREAADTGRQLLAVSMHHIVSDGWSVQVLLEELVAFYRARVLGEAAALAELPIQYADYAAWQRDWLEAGERERQLGYWKAALGEAHPVLALPMDGTRHAHGEYTAARHRLALPASLAQAVRACAQRRSATPFMVLLAAFQALLHRYTGQDDIRVGVPVANRHRVETERLIGFFVNTQVMRACFDGSDTPHTLLERLREATLGAQAHQDLPFDLLVEALRPERSLSHAPLFQVMFNHQRRDWRVLDGLPGLTIEPHRLPATMAQFELMLNTQEEADGTLTLEFSYARELFAPASIVRLAAHYQRCVAAIAQGDAHARIADLALADEAERATLDAWSRNPTCYGELEPVFRAFERHAAAHPGDEALVFGDAALRYGELNARANRLAHWLRARGIGVESRVGVSAERSLELVIALYAIMKAGAAYVPLDPSYPAERLAAMIDDSGLGLLLAQRDIGLPAREGVERVDLDTLDLSDGSALPADNPGVALDGANLAYVIFTSGSTGRPKGVGNRHDGLSNRLVWMQREYGLRRGETVLQKTPFSFDVSVWEFFWPLMVGARLAIAAPGAHRDPAELAQTIVAHRVTTLHFVPSMLQAFVASEAQAGACGATLKRIVCSGEALPADLRERVANVLPGVDLFNLYGPTEAAIDVSAWRCVDEAGRAVPIGRPIAATQTWVLDARLNPVPPGVPGELYLGGAGLARGYLGRADLTAERFVPDPFATAPGARLYRTGDLARWRADGVLDYLGRVDHQVKIRGLRIELGEIESALTALAAVREAVVVARDGRLVGYVTGEAGEGLDPGRLRAALAARLPDYMVPWRIVVLAALPLSSNGKVDRRALPAPEPAAAEDAQHEAPREGVEADLAAIWAELLGTTRIGRHDSFFDLGGHSLLAVRLNARIGLDLNASLPLATLFDARTLAAQAEAIERVRAAQPGGDTLRDLDLFMDSL